MERVRITKRVLESTVATSGDRTVWDSELVGFGVRVRASGRKAYVVQHRLGKGRAARQRKFTLGTFPELTPDQARADARQLIARLHREPEAFETESKRADVTKTTTVRDLADRWYRTDGRFSRIKGPTYGQLRKPENMAIDWCRIERHVLPLIGDRAVAELNRRDIQKLHDDIAAGVTAGPGKAKGRGCRTVTGGPGTAAKTVQILSTILSFAVREEVIESNPAFGIRKAPTRKLNRFLSKLEIDALREALRDDEDRVSPNHGVAVIRLLLLTGCRKGEIEGLRWREVDLRGGYLRFEATKTGARAMPLSQPAVDVLSALPRSRNEWVFPASRGDGPFVGTKATWRRVAPAAGLSDVRLHDLRHTFASIGAAEGLSLPMIGALLGHRQPSTTARYAHLTDVPVRQAAALVAGRIETETQSASEETLLGTPPKRCWSSG